jgi:phosphatidylglycerol:prolipoprotein diacylglycerol transferase
MDIVAPVLMIGLGFGRIGCFLNGCCYGDQCQLPWAVQFPYYSEAYQDQFAQSKIAPPLQLVFMDERGFPALVPPHSQLMADDPQLAALAASQKALPVHPAELYSSFTAFLLAALLIAYFGLHHIDGRVFALMMMLEGVARFVLELVRVEPPVWTVHIGVHTYGWSISMFLGLAVAAAGVVMWEILGATAPKLVVRA